MKNFTLIPLRACAGLLIGALLSGCGRQAASDPHAGHDHGEASGHRSTKDGVEMCTEHGVPEAQCAICKPDAVAKLKPGEAMQVRLPSPDSASIVGVKVQTPAVGGADEAVECMAELSFNQNRLAQVAAPVGGLVQAVEVDLGSRVEEGQLLARIWSAAISEVVAKSVLTHQTLERERRLRGEHVTSLQSLQEAEALHRAACQQARSFGFSEAQIDEFGRRPDDPVYLELRAPFAGEVIERSAVRGALVEAGRALFTIADTSSVWAMLQVPESTLPRIRTGQEVELRVDSLPGENFSGKLTWVGAGVDAHTRMARARAEFPNADRRLKDGMFASARILTRRSESALLVPASAIQHLDGQPLVFVQLAEDLYAARAVRLGARSGERQEVMDGLQAQDRVAVDRVFAIKSAMLMSRLGAGCADD